ncbi:hypothetical protein OHA98_21175 [Streptomyces sp. NBC_00654]|uniref:hypothetical protein n=1 Tax=Streptomyces sp. NBC_00654 TaxID=2975799 RepID=UPI002251D064|nr:hypothetical protein [Streptomyces sp. NBC_00654]MCX4967235.1 hypothetical protein [Streptomyces sp. NBC_00654]
MRYEEKGKLTAARVFIPVAILVASPVLRIAGAPIRRRCLHYVYRDEAPLILEMSKAAAVSTGSLSPAASSIGSAGPQSRSRDLSHAEVERQAWISRTCCVVERSDRRHTLVGERQGMFRHGPWTLILDGRTLDPRI